MTRTLLVSTYELGRQPFGLASPTAWLRQAGCEVECVDTTKQPLPDASLASADLVAFHLQMHTATRLAAPLIARARRVNRRARICAFGLYAPPNASWLRALGVDDVPGGEFKGALTAIAAAMSAPPGLVPPVAPAAATVPRLQFLVPDRSGLPPLARYARL